MKKYIISIIGILVIFLVCYTSVFSAPNNTMSITPAASDATVIEASDENTRNSEISTKYNIHTHTDITSTSANFSVDGGTFIFNESAADKDFRFEGSSAPNLLYGDASTDRVGIGTSTPAATFEVENADITDTTTLAIFDMDGSGVGVDIYCDAANLPALKVDSKVADGGDSFQVKHEGAIKFAIERNDALTTGATWILGGFYFWVDATDDLRIKSSKPSSDTDGFVVGGQS